MDLVFHALADPTRRAILRRLSREPECCVTDLAEPFEMSLNAVSKHLKVLEQGGLLRRTRDGRVHRCSADFKVLTDVTALLVDYQAFWSKRFDDLDAYLNEVARLVGSYSFSTFRNTILLPSCNSIDIAEPSA